MARNILILGASYGSLLATKLLMAGHNVTLVCRRKTADLINRDGTEVRIKLRDEAVHRAIFSRDLPGKLDATTPDASPEWTPSLSTSTRSTPAVMPRSEVVSQS